MSKENKRIRTFVKHFANPFLRYLTYFSRGPFALLCHIGRRSGKTFETPVMVWPGEDGFVIALTYGRKVDWLRNLQAASQGTLRWHKHEYTFQPPVFVDEQTVWPLFPPLITFALRKFGVHDFVKLVSQPAPRGKARAKVSVPAS